MTSWAVGVPGGGVRPPSPRAVCTRWRPATDINDSTSPHEVAGFRVDPDGVLAVLHFRDCGDPVVRQFVWVRREPPEVVARVALSALSTRLLLAPEVLLSPPGEGIVNVETWLAAADPGLVSATATIPGLSVTVTATVTSTRWDLGGTPVTCDGTGTPWSESAGDRAPCGHTFRRPAANQVITARYVWGVTWRASTGASGSLDDVVSTPVVVVYPVVEIQTVGTRG